MKNIIATLRAKSGQGAALENELRELVNATGCEPGAMVYDLLRDESQPDTLVVYERYRDAASKADHLASDHLKKALGHTASFLAEPPRLQHLTTLSCIRNEQLDFEGGRVELVALPIGNVRLVYAKTDRGLLACGAIDPAALEKFGIATARVKPTRGTSIDGFEDLLVGEVRESNPTAQGLGIVAGMPGREALRKLLG